MRVASSLNASYRRMGAILVENGAITADQLDEALLMQGSTGRMLGEICVENWGMDRLALADALSVQWDEMRGLGGKSGPQTGASTVAESTVSNAEEDDLRALLEEAESTRAEFALKTEELTRRLAMLETLVISVSGALEDLRAAND